MKFKQKYSLVAFLEPVEVGFEFFWKDQPLHVSLASVFAVDMSEAFMSKLAKLVAGTAEFTLQAEGDMHWGLNGEYHVVGLRKSPEIINFHTAVHELLVEAGATFNELQFEAGGYAPHATIQKHARLHKGEEITISSLSIVDMFPAGDGYQRKILKTMHLGL